jgi:hypothetical protein
LTPLIRLTYRTALIAPAIGGVRDAVLDAAHSGADI